MESLSTGSRSSPRNGPTQKRNLGAPKSSLDHAADTTKFSITEGDKKPL
jgi:hypothetical protein